MILSTLIDAVMLGSTGYAIFLACNTDVEHNCFFLDTKIYVYTMTAISVLRCYHLILMILFLLFWALVLMPCLICFPNCCCSRWLAIKSAKAPKSVITQLKTHWSWQYYLLEDYNIKNLPADVAAATKALKSIKSCSYCLHFFERGESVTYLPCQLGKMRDRKS